MIKFKSNSYLINATDKMQIEFLVQTKHQILIVDLGEDVLVHHLRILNGFTGLLETGVSQEAIPSKRSKLNK